MVCAIAGLDSPCYQDSYAYLNNDIIPPHLTKT